MKHAKPTTLAKDAGLQQRGPGRVPKPCDWLVQARLNVLPSAQNASVQAIEPAGAQRERERGKERKRDAVT